MYERRGVDGDVDVRERVNVVQRKGREDVELRSRVP
jgi:hypothetical protein